MNNHAMGQLQNSADCIQQHWSKQFSQSRNLHQLLVSFSINSVKSIKWYKSQTRLWMNLLLSVAWTWLLTPCCPNRPLRSAGEGLLTIPESKGQMCKWWCGGDGIHKHEMCCDSTSSISLIMKTQWFSKAIPVSLSEMKTETKQDTQLAY